MADGVEVEAGAVDEVGEQFGRVAVGGGAQAAAVGEGVVDGVGLAGFEVVGRAGGLVGVAVAQELEVAAVLAGFDQGQGRVGA